MYPNRPEYKITTLEYRVFAQQLLITLLLTEESWEKVPSGTITLFLIAATCLESALMIPVLLLLLWRVVSTVRTVRTVRTVSTVSTVST
jgi:hypothetical protein